MSKGVAHSVAGAGGVRLHVREAGNPEGAPLLLIHGWSQHHLCWSRQFEGALAEEFRLIAPDLRGHGASDKPLDAECYDNSVPWAGDIAAIMDQLGLDRPLLVGWSMGGWAVCDYLRHHGDAAISGAALIGSSIRVGRAAEGPDTSARAARGAAMSSQDQGPALDATIDFIRTCVGAPLSKRDLAFMVGYNMLCPPHVRRAALARDEDYGPDISALLRPLGLFWGAAERVCPLPRRDEALECVPDARSFTYSGAGHAPFWERPEQFNADLAAFAREAFAMKEMGDAA